MRSFHYLARWWRWLTRQPVTLEIRGSKPLWVAKIPVAQLVEQHTYNMKIRVQIPTGRVMDILLVNQR